MKIPPVLKTINRKFIVLSSDLHSFSHKCSDAPLQLLSCPQEETDTKYLLFIFLQPKC